MLVLQHHAFTTINTKQNLSAIADELEDTALTGRLELSCLVVVSEIWVWVLFSIVTITLIMELQYKQE